MEPISQILKDINRRGRLYREEHLAPLGINTRYAAYLREIAAEPGISQEQLARRICVNKSNVARNAAAMEEGNAGACRRTGTGTGGNTDDVRRGQRIAKYRLVHKSRHTQGKAADDANHRPAEAQGQKHTPLHPVTGQEFLQGKGILSHKQTGYSQSNQYDRSGCAEDFIFCFVGRIVKDKGVNELVEAFDKLSKEYDIYAPKRFKKQGRYSDTDIIRYDIVTKAEEIVFDEKSDFPAKEVLSPITQTLYYFTEDEYRESKEKSKKILIFMRPCDVAAMEHQNKIYLQNGGFCDTFYARLEEKIKIVLMECKTGWDTCFCVSMGSNKTNEYAAAVRAEEDGWKVEVKCGCLAPYFSGEEVDFTPEFVTENEIKVTIPEIKDKKVLNALKKHPMWKEYDSRCLSCGACTIACATCTCFTTTDIAYNENANVG